MIDGKNGPSHQQAVSNRLEVLTRGSGSPNQAWRRRARVSEDSGAMIWFDLGKQRHLNQSLELSGGLLGYCHCHCGNKKGAGGEKVNSVNRVDDSSQTRICHTLT